MPPRHSSRYYQNPHPMRTAISIEDESMRSSVAPNAGLSNASAPSAHEADHPILNRRRPPAHRGPCRRQPHGRTRPARRRLTAPATPARDPRGMGGVVPQRIRWRIPFHGVPCGRRAVPVGGRAIAGCGAVSIEVQAGSDKRVAWWWGVRCGCTAAPGPGRRRPIWPLVCFAPQAEWGVAGGVSVPHGMFTRLGDDTATTFCHH